MAANAPTIETTDSKHQAAGEIELRNLAGEADKIAFRTLNEEWISRYFALEPKDRETLNDPDGIILSKGGRILIAGVGGAAVGCVALIPVGDGVPEGNRIPGGNQIYELSKMAVSPAFRGRGIGRRIIQYAIAQARELGATSLFLGSNATLKDAVHLYESVGFTHVPLSELPDMPYARANVFMKMLL